MVGAIGAMYTINGGPPYWQVLKLSEDYEVLANYSVTMQHGTWTCTCESRVGYCKHRDMAQSMLNDPNWPKRIAAGYKRDSKNKRWIAPAILAHEMEQDDGNDAGN